MTDPRIASFQKEVEKISQYLHTEYSKLQTGRANAAVVEHITVDAYGQKQPLKNVAGISIQDARTIAIQPWDPSIIQMIEKALGMAELGATPVSDGRLIRINLPTLTQERREQLKKVVSNLAEEARISVRKARQTAHDVIKAEKEEDVRETMLEFLQKEVDKANVMIDDSRKKKEEEIMKV